MNRTPVRLREAPYRPRALSTGAATRLSSPPISASARTASTRTVCAALGKRVHQAAKHRFAPHVGARHQPQQTDSPQRRRRVFLPAPHRLHLHVPRSAQNTPRTAGNPSPCSAFAIAFFPQHCGSRSTGFSKSRSKARTRSGITSRICSSAATFAAFATTSPTRSFSPFRTAAAAAAPGPASRDPAEMLDFFFDLPVCHLPPRIPA